MILLKSGFLSRHNLEIWAIIVACTCISFSSCNNNGLTRSYELAGDNKSELKAVINHYRGDSKKLQAAKYLIANMADKGEIRYYSDGHNEIIPDVETITSNYLINNIDLSFEVWQKYPWCSDLSFKEFCEEILPYRMRNEPLEDWRRFYYEKYKSIADSLARHYTNRKEVALYFNNNHRKFYRPDIDTIVGDISYTVIEQNRGGSCIQLVLNAAQEMRAFGFPLNIDNIPSHGKINDAHAYNSFIDENGVCIGFSPYSPNLTGNGMTAHVINRIFFQKPRYRKVTEQYYAVSDITLNEAHISLATYNNGRFKTILHPESTTANKSLFERLTQGLLYFPVRQDGAPAKTPPFILDEAGQLIFYNGIIDNRDVTLNDIGLYWYRTRVKVEEGIYVLFGWDDGWKEIAHTKYENDYGLNFGSVPHYGLFLVIGGEERGHKQRPFIIVDGKPEYY